MTNQEPENTDIPKATHLGVMKIGDLEIEIAVLEDGRRLVTEKGMGTFLNFLNPPKND